MPLEKGIVADELEKRNFDLVAEDGEYRIYAPPSYSNRRKSRFLCKYDREEDVFKVDMIYEDEDDVR